MKKLVPVIIISAMLLTGCGILAPAVPATPMPSPTAAYVFTDESFPALGCSASLLPLAEAAAAVTLGETREAAAARVSLASAGDCLAALSAGETELALIPAYPLPPEGIDSAVVAEDALVFCVHASNPVKDLSAAQLRDIFTGRYSNWSELGGEDLPITLCLSQEGSGSRAALEELLLEGGALSGEGGVFEGDPGAIAFAFLYGAEAMGLLPDGRLLTVEGAAPSAETVESGEYPFAVDYIAAVSAGAAEGSPARVLWLWLQGTEGQRLISSQGYVPANRGV